MRVQVRMFKFLYAFAYIFRFRGAQNHTVRSRMLNYGNYHGKCMIINTNSPRYNRQLYDYGVFSRPPKYNVLVALVGEGKGPGCGFKFAGSRSRVQVRVRRSKPYGNSGAKLYDYDTFTRPPKYSYLCSVLSCALLVIMYLC